MQNTYPSLATKLDLIEQPVETLTGTSIVAHEETNNEMSIVTSEKRTREAAEDYQRARELHQKVAETGLSALEGINFVANSTGEPRAYEVMASLMKALNETAKQMHEMHNTDGDGKKTGSNVKIEGNAVFVGSQDELLNMLKKK